MTACPMPALAIVRSNSKQVMAVAAFRVANLPELLPRDKKKVEEPKKEEPKTRFASET